jgi:hypothetical protein
MHISNPCRFRGGIIIKKRLEKVNWAMRIYRNYGKLPWIVGHNFVLDDAAFQIDIDSIVDSDFAVYWNGQLAKTDCGP